MKDNMIRDFKITQAKVLKDRICERIWREHGMEINTGQLMILCYLWNHDHETISQISQQTLLARNTVSITINGMVKKGLVVRNINPHDRRQTIVSLTAYGKSILAQYTTVEKQLDELIYTGFTEQEREALEGYLTRIIQTMVEYEYTNVRKA